MSAVPEEPAGGPGNEATDGRLWSALRAHMRHELRTPLNAIIGYSEMLLEDAGELDHPDVGPIRRDLGNIHAAGTRLLSLINDLLDPAVDVPADGPALPPEHLSPQVRFDLRTPLNHIFGYSEILLENVEQAGLPGFSPELQKIRTAGEKLLSLLEEVVSFAEMEGLEQPAVREATVRDVVRALRPGEGDEPAPAQEPGAILVVEDNEMNRDVLCRRLEREGHTVTAVESGPAALDLLRREDFDLVLLDLMMPEMSGYQVLQHVKADPALFGLPVIMISALDELESVVRCIEAGAEDYLTKPFDPVLLRARVEASLEKKRLRDREALYLRQIEREKQRSEELLHVILPAQVVEELKMTNRVRPRLYEEVAVMFCDVVGFTPYCETRDPEDVFHALQRVVEAYEELALEHGLEKIKTIGDSFMATAGLLRPVPDPALCAVKCALEMLVRTRDLQPDWDLRIGIHIGPVMAGVVGHRQYIFDLWGDTVNTAARIESQGEPGAVNVSRVLWDRLAETCDGVSLGPVLLKGKGAMEIVRVTGVRGRALEAAAI